jgi:hypothetical protein
MNDAARQIQEAYRRVAYDLLHVVGRAAAEYATAHPELKLSHEGTFNPPLGPLIERPANLTVHRDLPNGGHWVVVAGFGMRTTVTPVHPGRFEDAIDWRAAAESGDPPLKVPISAQWTATNRFGLPLVRDMILDPIIVEGSTVRWNHEQWTGVAAVDASTIIERIFAQTILRDSPDTDWAPAEVRTSQDSITNSAIEVDVRPPENIYEANRNSILSAIGVVPESLQVVPPTERKDVVRRAPIVRSQKLIFESATDIYTPGSILGQGGSGIVYQATDGSGKAVAIKLLQPNVATTEKIKRFKNELWFGLRHPHAHIVEILDFGRAFLKGKSAPFYVMPLYDCSLRRLIDERLNADQILRYFTQILDGLEFAHSFGVYHRDLKPENVFVRRGTDTLVVGDFGAAHFAEDMLATIVETTPGTRLANFQYAAPEQRTKDAGVDWRADLYAIGLILNEMFTGNVPHGTSYALIESVSTAHAYLDEVVDRLLRNAKEQRYASVAELRKVLRV